MKKIFFIFAMMLMSVVSALAEESYEEFYMTGCVLTYHGEHNHFTVSGDDNDCDGFYISDGKVLMEGSHEYLLKNCKEYKKLYNSEIDKLT